MKIFKIAFSTEAPSVKDTLWARPVAGGFTIYLPDGGTWIPLKVVDENNTNTTIDDVAINVKNKADKVSSATKDHLASLNSNGNLQDSGKKASDFEAAGAAAQVQTTLIGTAEDSAEDMTLYGLKAYIDSKTS